MLQGSSEIWAAERQTLDGVSGISSHDHMLTIATYNELHFVDWSQPIPVTKCNTSNEKEEVR
jgi:hypothetical protein